MKIKKGKMKCKWCSKKLKGRKDKRYCNESCRRKNYYKRNRKRKIKYSKEYLQKNLYNLCKCGNRKFHTSKHCQKCHRSNKIKGQLSRLPSLK